MASLKLNFGKRTIEAIKPPASGRARYKDTQSRFLYLDVHPTGRKTFLYVRWLDGKTKFVKIGDYPEMTPFTARERAEKIGGDIQNGETPTGRKNAGMTFAELFQEYLNDGQKRKQEWIQYLFDNYMKELHTLPVKRITPEAIRTMFKGIAKKHGEVLANRVLAFVRAAFNKAIENGAFIPNPTAQIKKFRERSRERYLDEIELRRFWEALDGIDPDWQDFFRLLIFTGARRGNVQSMRWEDIDTERELWTIPAEFFKTGEKTEIVLTKEALEIIERRRAKAAPEAIYVFPSHGKSGHITEPKGAWDRLLKKAGIKDLHVHDLRRTFGAWQAKTGASLPIIGKALGHKDTGATAIYARLDLKPVRDSIETATAAMMKAVHPEAKADEAEHSEEEKTA